MGTFEDYLKALRTDFQKRCRLRFLQPDGSTAFLVDNNPRNPLSSALLADGSISMHWQNGRRRSAGVTLENAGGSFDYNINRIWFGTEIALDEGLVLPDWSEFYIQQGVFLTLNPVETYEPGRRTVRLNLVDKSANLDGTLMGQLPGEYWVYKGENIFEVMRDILREDRGNGLPRDAVTPVFTDYYNDKTITLPDGTTARFCEAPHDLEVDSDSGTAWDVISGLCDMVKAEAGYDESGALRVDTSQNEVLDADKPVAWRFRPDEAQLLGASYTLKNSEVFNDYIVISEVLSNYDQPMGRAENYDPRSDTNIRLIGRKTMRISGAEFYTDRQCMDWAEWMLKQTTVLRKSVEISCTQMFHLHGNELVTLRRSDKPGAPEERHLVRGWTRSLAGNRPMRLDVVSVQDLPIATVTSGRDATK